MSSLLDRLDTIINLLQNADYCCNTAPESETVDSDYSGSVPGTDTPPGTWGDGEPVTDTDDWAELVCGAAHAYVDHLISMANQLQTLLDLATIGFGVVAAALGLLTGAGIILSISYGAAASAVAGLAEFIGTAIMSQAALDLESAREDIVCEVIQGDLAGAVQNAVSGSAWTAFFQFVDYSSARNVMLEGSHGEEHLGVNRRTDCDCDNTIFEYSVDFGSTTDGRGDFVGGSLDDFNLLLTQSSQSAYLDIPNPGPSVKITVTWRQSSPGRSSQIDLNYQSGGNIAESPSYTDTEEHMWEHSFSATGPLRLYIKGYGGGQISYIDYCSISIVPD